MAFNIDKFTAAGLQFGGVRPTLFNVEMSWPQGFLGANDKIAEKFRFTCRASSVPASTIASVDVPYFGRTVKVAGDRTFADWSVTVMNDEDFSVRNGFEDWHGRINDIVKNLRITPATAEGPTYKGTAYVTQYGKAGDIIKQYTFVNIFPVQIDEMALDWETTNQIQTFGVTFAYDYWVPGILKGGNSTADVVSGTTTGVDEV